MKNWLIGFLVVIFLILLGVKIYAYNHPLATIPSDNLVSPSPIASPLTLSFCSPTVLQPQIETEPAAGNIWGTATITNNGTTPCQILGNNFLEAGVEPSIKNITATNQGSPGSETFTLTPGQSVYSQIHYPNGPQCSGAPKQVAVSFSYKISTIDRIVFHALDGKATFQIPSCTDPKEITDIQVWPLSDQQRSPADQQITQ